MAKKVSTWLIASIALEMVVLLAPQPPLVSAEPARKPFAPYFVDSTAAAGIEFHHENGASPGKFLVETYGSGVAWIDYDGDGWLDLYFVNGSKLEKGARSPGNVLYRNDRDGAFKDVTQTAGVAGNGAYGMGVAVGDFDDDGLPDLFLANFGPNQLYRNNGDGTFSDVTETAGVSGGDVWNSSAGFLDYDLDGDLDLFVGGALDFTVARNTYCGRRAEGYRSYCDPMIFEGVPDRLYENNGDGAFTDVSAKSGVANPAGKCLGVAFGDFNNDGYPDIYVANDGVRNFLYENQGDGTFVDVAYEARVGYDQHGRAQAGMGVGAVDVDADGLLDIFVTNFSEELNTLYQNKGSGRFEDISEAAGLSSGFEPLGFGLALADFDNDGDTDIYVANGHVLDNVDLYHPGFSYAQTDLLYLNEGGRFRDVSTSGGPAFRIRRVGRGAAVGDYDNDGSLDLAVNNSGAAPLLMKNEGRDVGHWISLRFRGKNSNSQGVGARVELSVGGTVQVKEFFPAGSYLSSNEPRLHFGLGTDSVVPMIEVLWPGGKRQTLTDVAADRIVTIEEPE